MTSSQFNSGTAPARRRLISGAALAIGAIGAIAVGAPLALAEGDGMISHNAESIHQERLFKASRARVYAALLTTMQFDEVSKLGAAMQSPGMAKMQHPSEIDPNPGGAFALFGGYISGRQIELVPDRMIVQAWRVGNWKPGVYSLARFELMDEGTSTKLIFDHTGFPVGEADHLASGWDDNYWTPLAKFLG